MSITVNQLKTMPIIQLFLSPACNLKCSYCSQIAVHEVDVTDDFSQDEKLLRWIETISPTHFFISGGEPLIHPGIVDFVKKASLYNHKISFDTNMTGSQTIFNQLMEIDNHVYGFFNISHHLEQNISLEYLIHRCDILKSKGIRHFIKYIGIPEHLDEITNIKKILKSKSIGFAFTIFQHLNWEGRAFPQDYTHQELDKCFNLVSTKTHAMQFFDGIYSKGIPCRGGNDFIVYNMHGEKEVNPCCSTSAYKLALENTYFETNVKEMQPCKSEVCIGDLMFLVGVNNVFEETQTLFDITIGHSITFKKQELFEYFDLLKHKGYKLINEKKYLKYRSDSE